MNRILYGTYTNFKISDPVEKSIALTIIVYSPTIRVRKKILKPTVYNECAFQSEKKFL